MEVTSSFGIFKTINHNVVIQYYLKKKTTKFGNFM